MATARLRVVDATDARWNVALIGAMDGVNLVYMTPEKFIQAGTRVIRVYRNGMRLTLEDDYTVEESGGASTGYDTVVLVAAAPLDWEHLTADYTAEE